MAPALLSCHTVTSRLLLIDDEETILFALNRYFTSQGYAVDCARTASEAEGMLDRGAYGAIIADVALTNNGREGLRLAEYARARNSGAAIILVTAYTSSEIEHEALRRGADVFVRKPQPLPVLAAILARTAARPRKDSNAL